MNSLPRTGDTRRQSVSAGSLGGEQQEQLGLERIGVLKLVHENAGEARLEVLPHGGVVTNQTSGADQQVEKVERALARLQSVRIRRHSHAAPREGRPPGPRRP